MPLKSQVENEGDFYEKEQKGVVHINLICWCHGQNYSKSSKNLYDVNGKLKVIYLSSLYKHFCLLLTYH